jgi:hypothetical protein
MKGDRQSIALQASLHRLVLRTQLALEWLIEQNSSIQPKEVPFSCFPPWGKGQQLLAIQYNDMSELGRNVLGVAVEFLYTE